MRARCSVSLTICVVLAALATLAPPAGASSKGSSKHFRLLAARPCSSVLNAYDFIDDLQEVAPVSVKSFSGLTLYSSSCTYAGTEEGAPGPFDGSFTDGLIGAECVANGIKLIAAKGTAPEAGCYRIAHASVAFTSGSSVKKYESKPEKGEGPDVALQRGPSSRGRRRHEGGIRLTTRTPARVSAISRSTTPPC